MDYGSLINFIESRKAPMQTFMEEMHKGAQERQAEAEAKYKEGELTRQNKMLPYDIQLKQAQAAQARSNVSNMPLRTDLLKAQIENVRALVEDRRKNGINPGGLTKSNITANQKVIQSSRIVAPMIKRLIADIPKMPNQLFGQYLDPKGQKVSESRAAALTDHLMAVQTLPKIHESMELVKKQAHRGRAESQAAYKKRLE